MLVMQAPSSSLSIIPGPQPRPSQVDAVGQHRQRFGRQLQLHSTDLSGPGPRKRAFFQPLDRYPQSTPVKVQDLQSRPTAIGEHIERTSSWIFAEAFTHQRFQTIEAFAQIARLYRDEHLQPTGKAQHPWPPTVSIRNSSADSRR